MDVNDIMGDPAHWKGNYEGRFRAARNTRAKGPEGMFDGSFDGNNRAVPYYTSNANFAGGIIVLMVLFGVLQFSHIQNRAQSAIREGRAVNARASLNLRDARNHAKNTRRRDMIESFQQRRDVRNELDNTNEMGHLISSRRK
jgi:hypothetical protein